LATKERVGRAGGHLIMQAGKAKWATTTSSTRRKQAAVAAFVVTRSFSPLQDRLQLVCMCAHDEVWWVSLIFPHIKKFPFSYCLAHFLYSVKKKNFSIRMILLYDADQNH
jgi:hypothetical protein